MSLKINWQATAVTVMATLFLVSCATISKFDQYAYTQTTSLKVDALQVMAKANDSFALHQTDVVNLQVSLSKMVEYEKNRPKNQISEKMWNVLTDSSGHLIGGFLTRWQQTAKLDTAFIRYSQELVSQSFDQLSQLESGKIKPNQLTY